jgi:hypothetical protein
MATCLAKVDAVDVQTRIEHRSAPFEQVVAQLRDLECAIECRPARRTPRPANAERNEPRHTDSKNALHDRLAIGEVPFETPRLPSWTTCRHSEQRLQAACQLS